jgi:hypothetical protein
MMSASGIVMRTRVSEISIQKRNTRGVRVIKLDEGDRLVGMAVIPPEIEEEIPEQIDKPNPEPVESPIPEPEETEDVPRDQKESPPPLWMNP